jgi:hypothetical protein
MLNNLKKVFETARNRQVMAVITYGTAPKKNYADTSFSSLFLQLSQDSTTVLRRKIWFNDDRCVLDKDLEEKIKGVIFKSEQIEKLYSKIGQNPIHALIREFPDQLNDEAVRETLQADVPGLIRVRLAGKDEAEAHIALQVPFERLQADLIRMNRALHSTGRGYIDNVDIAHSPVMAPKLTGRTYKSLFPDYRQ